MAKLSKLKMPERRPEVDTEELDLELDMKGDGDEEGLEEMGPSLESLSDAELLAEVKKRGLSLDELGEAEEEEIDESEMDY